MRKLGNPKSPIAALGCPADWAGMPVSIASRPVEECSDSLHTHELSIIQRFGPLRRNTFSSGRRCARDLLNGLGGPSEALLRAQDGSVMWPAGYMGSISHTDEWAVAAVAVESSGVARALGIDLEPRKVLLPKLLAKIATPGEIAAMQARKDWQSIAIFSLKESLYKCLRPSFGEFIRFHDVEICALDSSRPTVRFCADELANHCDPQELELRLLITADHVFSMVWWRVQRL